MTILPVLGLSRGVLFPGQFICMHVRHDRSKSALRAAQDSGNSWLGVFASHDGSGLRCCDVGTVARVISVGQGDCCGQMVTELEGLARVRAVGSFEHEDRSDATCERLEEASSDQAPVAALVTEIRNVAESAARTFPSCRHTDRVLERFRRGVSDEHVPGGVQDLLLRTSCVERQRALEASTLGARLEATLTLLEQAWPVALRCPDVVH